MQNFPWNLPEEWLPELPINRELLAARYGALTTSLDPKHLNAAGDIARFKKEIASAINQDSSALTISERGLLHQALLKFFNVDGDSSNQTSGVPPGLGPRDGGNQVALTASEDDEAI